MTDLEDRHGTASSRDTVWVGLLAGELRLVSFPVLTMDLAERALTDEAQRPKLPLLTTAEWNEKPMRFLAGVTACQ